MDRKFLLTFLLVAAVFVVVVRDVHAAEPNDDFASRTVLTAGVVTAVDDITAGTYVGPFPDLTLGAFDEFDGLIDSDDDGSPIGDGFASGLFVVPVNADGTIRLVVSGYADFDFDGMDDIGGNLDPHLESGDIEIFVDLYDSDDEFVTGIGILDTLVEGGTVSHVLDAGDFGLDSDAVVADLDDSFTYDAITNNVAGPPDVPGDVDYYTFTGLPAGVEFTAEVTEGDFDTVLGWFDSSGAEIAEDDDGGVDLLSLLVGVVPGDGEVHLAVSGFDDFDFTGVHTEAGSYTLSVTVPEPGSCVLVAVPSVLLMMRKRGV